MKNWIYPITLILLSLTRLSAQAPEKHFGIGILAGEPSGISAKINLTDTASIQGAAAWTFEDSEEERLQYQLDWIMHMDATADGISMNEYRGYIGMGFLYKTEEDKAQDVYGVRVPFGVVMSYDEFPFELFFELVPVMNVSPNTDFDFNAGIGIRVLLF
ncbi:hypothetical protein P0Y35_13635 [Kiritimatiellaeota bacterium B1221]|nr:hypothetical protein [Kiritimatiellaeota bacterium B1221]